MRAWRTTTCSSIDPWRKMLALHFSTWPEVPGDTRSDSHAWTAHPIYDLLTLVAGIEPASPGFATVRIAPHMGDAAVADGDVSASGGRDPRGVHARRRGAECEGDAAGQSDGDLCLQRKDEAAETGRELDSGAVRFQWLKFILRGCAGLRSEREAIDGRSYTR